MDWLIVIWTAFVLVVYIGGYYLPVLGAYTVNLTAVYALVFIAAVAALALRARRSASGGPSAPEVTPPPRER